MTEGPAPAEGALWQFATVVRISEGTPRIKTFVIRLSSPFDFRAGQHVDIRLTAPDGYRAIRSYSIASAPPGRDGIALAVERLDDGEISPFLHDVVRVGDQIELRGPLGGHFIWPARGSAAILLVGGGSGVVPLLSMVRHRRASADPRRLTLVYSVRTASDILYRDELLALDAREDGFDLTLVITREAPFRPVDYARRIDVALLSAVVARSTAAIGDAFVCGANAFVNAVADSATEIGIPADAIRTERYGV